MSRLTNMHLFPPPYRSGMNPKTQRNFEVFALCEFIAAITQHIPDKSF